MKRHRHAWLGGAALAAVAAAVLAGCGGSKTYSLAATRACLKEAGVPLKSKVDFVASTALDGALSAKLEKNEITIAFGRDEAEAARIAKAYRRFAGSNIGINDVLDPEQNAVLLWAVHPTDEDAATIHGCLK